MLLETEGLLHAELAAEGHATFLAADVEIAHANVESAPDLLRSAMLGGRLFAANRVRHSAMSSPEKPPGCSPPPLVFVVRGRRLARDVARVRTIRALPSATLAYGITALAAHAAGEVLGYMVGRGEAAAYEAEYELNRAGYIGPGIMDPPPRPPSHHLRAPKPAPQR